MSYTQRLVPVFVKVTYVLPIAILIALHTYLLFNIMKVKIGCAAKIIHAKKQLLQVEKTYICYLGLVVFRYASENSAVSQNVTILLAGTTHHLKYTLYSGCKNTRSQTQLYIHTHINIFIGHMNNFWKISS